MSYVQNRNTIQLNAITLRLLADNWDACLAATSAGEPSNEERVAISKLREHTQTVLRAVAIANGKGVPAMPRKTAEAPNARQARRSFISVRIAARYFGETVPVFLAMHTRQANTPRGSSDDVRIGAFRDGTDWKVRRADVLALKRLYEELSA